MANRVAGREVFRSDLERYMGTNRLFPFLERQTVDTALWEDDFLGDVIDTKYTVTNGGGGSVASFAVVAGTVNGAVRATTGTQNDVTASANLTLGRHFRADQACTIMARFTLSSISDVKVEFGFSDILDAGLNTANEGLVTVQATPSFDTNANDLVVWSFDTTQDGDWHGIGNDTDVAATTIDHGFAPIANTYETLMIELVEEDSGVATAQFRRFNADGGLTYTSSTRMADACTSTVLLTPWIYINSLSASSVNFDLDYLSVWQRKTA